MIEESHRSWIPGPSLTEIDNDENFVTSNIYHHHSSKRYSK